MLTETLFTKGDNGIYPLRDVWGYSDGKKIFIKSAENYFELVKKQNTFISYAAKDLSRNKTRKIENILMVGVIGSSGQGNKRVSYTLNRKIFQLDMDSGEIF